MSHSLIISLDKLDPNQIEEVLDLIWSVEDTLQAKIKIKFNDLINRIGFEWISQLRGIQKHRIMLDPKWNDIPNTITNYFYQLKQSPLWEQTDYITLHTNGGRTMIEAAKKARDELWLQTKIISVTALTSLEEKDIQEIYWLPPQETVIKLTRIALESWADGIVCSPLEIASLRKEFWNNFIGITPWVRFEWSENIGDQKRITTPKQTIVNWVNDIVMWRDILSWDIKANIERFFLEINS